MTPLRVVGLTVGLLLVAVIAVFVVIGIQPDEDTLVQQAELTIVNESDGLIYYAVGSAGEARPTSGKRYSAVLADESLSFGVGGPRLESSPGCFTNSEVWIIRSAAGQPIDRLDRIDETDVVELRHYPSTTCGDNNGLVRFLWR